MGSSRWVLHDRFSTIGSPGPLTSARSTFIPRLRRLNVARFGKVWPCDRYRIGRLYAPVTPSRSRGTRNRTVVAPVRTRRGAAAGPGTGYAHGRRRREAEGNIPCRGETRPGGRPL